MWDLIVSVPGHCLCFYFIENKVVFLFFLFTSNADVHMATISLLTNIILNV